MQRGKKEYTQNCLLLFLRHGCNKDGLCQYNAVGCALFDTNTQGWELAVRCQFPNFSTEMSASDLKKK